MGAEGAAAAPDKSKTNFKLKKIVSAQGHGVLYVCSVIELLRLPTDPLKSRRDGTEIGK